MITRDDDDDIGFRETFYVTRYDLRQMSHSHDQRSLPRMSFSEIKVLPLNDSCLRKRERKQIFLNRAALGRRDGVDEWENTSKRIFDALSVSTHIAYLKKTHLRLRQ